MLVGLVLSLLLSSCSNSQKTDEKQVDIKEEKKTEEELGKKEEKKKEKTLPYTVTDSLGREVKFEKVPEKVIVMGWGSLKYYTYVAGPEQIIGVDHAETAGHTVIGQSIHLAYPEIQKSEIIGKGGPKFQPDYEKIIVSGADVIVSSYASSVEEVDEFQEKVKIPVVAIATPKKGKIFDEENYKTLAIIGDLMAKEDRAEEIINFMKNTVKDLTDRTSSLDKSKSPFMYLGGCSFRGAQGILSTKSHLDLLEVSNANNIMDDKTEEAGLMIDKEALLSMDPELILLDLSGKVPLEEDMKADSDFYKSLSAFKNNKVFAILPYATYGLNYDTAMIDMYYIGSLAYPNAFKDMDINKKAEEIYKVFVGKNVLTNMMDAYPEGLKEFKLND